MLSGPPVHINAAIGSARTRHMSEFLNGRNTRTDLQLMSCPMKLVATWCDKSTVCPHVVGVLLAAMWVSMRILFICALFCAYASAAATNSMAPITKPTTSNNGQSACVQYGDCTKGANTAKTESYSSAIRPPASHSVPYLSNARDSSSYKASVAAAGASAAYDPKKNHGSSTAVPPPTTVRFDTKVSSSGSIQVTKSQMDGSTPFAHACVGASTLALGTLLVVAAMAL